jgi:hypothetical protein
MINVGVDLMMKTTRGVLKRQGEVTTLMTREAGEDEEGSVGFQDEDPLED